MRSVADALVTLDSQVAALATAHPALTGAWSDVTPEWDSGSAFEYLDRQLGAVSSGAMGLVEALDREHSVLDEASGMLHAAEHGFDAALALQQSIEAQLRQASRDMAIAGDAVSQATDACARAADAAERVADLVTEAAALLDEGPWS